MCGFPPLIPKGTSGSLALIAKSSFDYHFSSQGKSNSYLLHLHFWTGYAHGVTKATIKFGAWVAKIRCKSGRFSMLVGQNL